MHHRDIESLARGRTFIHRLDPRAKLVTVLLFTAFLVATPKYAVARLVPFAIVPAFVLFFGQVPGRTVLRALAMMAPFVVLVAVWNPVYDRTMITVHGTLQVRAGWLSCLNVILRFVLAAGALVGVMATTPFHKLLEGLRRLHLPRMFVTVLALVYRYLFELVDVALRLLRARDLRGGRARLALRFRSSAGVVGSLFVRSLDQSDRIYKAMVARGFDGEIRTIGTLRMRPVDWIFAAATSAVTVAVYLFVVLGSR